MPTIAELITAYRDRTGTPSYEELARKVRDELLPNRLHQLHTTPPKTFATPRTMELLAELLEVPVATILKAYASSLGIAVKETEPALLQMLPPGTDKLTDDDLEVVRVVVRRLVALRGQMPVAAQSPLPELPEPTPENLVDLRQLDPPDVTQMAARREDSEGRHLRRVQDDDAES